MAAGPEWLLLGEALGVTPTPMAMPEVYLSLKTGSIDGQENPLTIMNAAKYYEVTEQVVLTAHLVQPVFYALRKETWDALSAEQKKVVQDAAERRDAQNNEARLADEKQVADRLKTQGLTVTAVDLKPFHDNADKVYAASDLAKAWNKDLLAAGRGDEDESERGSRRCAAPARAGSSAWRATLRILRESRRGRVRRSPLRRCSCCSSPASSPAMCSNSPLVWSDELIMIMFLWVVFLTEAFVITEREQVTFDGIYDLVGERWRRAIQATGALLIARDVPGRAADGASTTCASSGASAPMRCSGGSTSSISASWSSGPPSSCAR